jgi:uncharacterized protein YlxW (UPF0749 family)
MRSKGAQITIAIVCLVLGIMLAIQFKASKSYSIGYTPERIEELAQKLTKVTDERDALANEVSSLQEKLSNIRKNDQAMADLQQELQISNMYGGLAATQGAGIILTVNDVPRRPEPGENPNNLIVHDLELLLLINELRASGAEAIAINDERITAMSEIRCVGTQVLVNTNPVWAPFVISVIGNPEQLESGLNIPGGWLSTMKGLGYPIHIQKMEKVEVPPYTGRIKSSFMKPVEYTKKAE